MRVINLRRLDLNLLLVLSAIFRERSVTAAAAELGLSQPTLSQSLAKLRAFFGDALFVRSRQGMMPTPFGETLREPVREILAVLERDIFPPVRFDPLTSRRTFTICSSDTGELCFLPSIMRAIAEQAPHITVRTVTLHPAELKEAFGAGAVDLALGNFPDLDPSATGTEELTTDFFVCIARAGHPIVRAPFTLEAYLRCEHAVVAARNRTQRLFEGTVARLGFDLRVRLRPEHFLSLCFIVGGSDLVATVPMALARAFAAYTDLVIMPAPFQIAPIVVAQHWHRRRESDPEVRWLRGLVRELFSGRDLASLAIGPDGRCLVDPGFATAFVCLPEEMT